MPKIINNNGQYRITIPKELVLSKKWKEGKVLRFVEDTDGKVYLENIIKNE